MKKYLFVVFLLSLLSNAFAQTTIEIDRYKAVFTEFPQNVPTNKAVDAPITGNGDIGLTMCPSEGKVVFYVGKNDFWKAVESYPDGTIALPGGITISADIIKEENYYAEQLPGTAELLARFGKGNKQLLVRTWVPAQDNKVIIELEAQAVTKLRVNLWTPDGLESKTEKGIEKGCAWVHRSFNMLPYLKWPTYMGMAMNCQNGEFELKPNEKQFVVLSIYTNHDTDKWHESAINGVLDLSSNEIEEIRRQHSAWWQSFWSLSSVSFDDVFLERYYYQSQYLFACASREGKFAPGLWGPFITSDQPAWGGDYHLNYNYESPYWACFSSNHISLTENYERPILDYMVFSRKHAKNLVSCRGVLYPVGLGPQGLCTSAWPKDPERMKAIYGVSDNTIEDGVGFWQQKINASFVASNMMMHFYCTYDKEYARKIYPFIKNCAEFWEDYLIYENGRYVVKGDSFNEQYPWRNYEGDSNSILSLGFIRMVFQGIDNISRFLHKDWSKRAKWKRILNRLSDYPTGTNDQGRISFKQSDNKNVKPNSINRIHIHGLLLPAGVTGPNLTPEYNNIMLADMMGWSSNSERDWGASLGNGVETVYPAAARVGYPANNLLRHLKERIEKGSYPNCYINASGGGIETLSAVPNTINEMMMQSYEGIIRIFPNWDRELDASFRDLRAYGAFLISSSMKNGQIISVSLKSEQGRPCKIENPWPTHSVNVLKNGRMWRTFDSDSFEFKTKKGDVFELLQ